MMRLNRLAVTSVYAAMGICASPIWAGTQTTVLYQGSGTQTPQSQGWLFSFAPGASINSTGGATTFNTTSNNSLEGGYSNDNLSGTPVNNSFPTLDPTSGFSVSFDVQINSESHTSTDRAGFDVIVLGSDKKGVELGFWSNDIWAQQISGTTFSRDGSEDVNIQNDSTYLTTSPTHYTLNILGSNYTLTTGTSSPVTILTGSTHDYTGAGILPYTLSNYIFIGDDTTSAGASETFSSLAVTVVPEPATAVGLLGLGLAGLSRRKRR